MFTKENIIVQNNTLKILNFKCDMTDYEKIQTIYMNLLQKSLMNCI